MKLKKILAMILCIAMVLSTVGTITFAEEADVWDGTSYSLDWLSTGNPEATAGDNFYLNSAEDLAGLAYYVNTYSSTNNIFTGDTVYLNVDVDLDNQDWAPIGTAVPREKNRFYGSFDGQGHTISNLKVGEGHYFAGLFGQIPTYDYTQTFSNITIENAVVVAADETSKNKEAAGALIGRANGTIVKNCHVTGEINISGDRFVGGLLGHSYAQISDCSVEASGTISADTWQSGGLVGSHGATATYTSSIENCSVIGNGDDGLSVTSYYTSVGGVIGSVSLTDVDSTPMDGITVANVSIAADSEDYGSGIAYVAVGYPATNSTTDNVSATLGNEEYVADDAANVEAAVAKIDNKYYTTLKEAIDNAVAGDTIYLIGTINEGSIKLPATITNLTIDGQETAVVKDTTINASDGNSVNYQGLTIKNTTFDNSRFVLGGVRKGDVIYKDIVFDNNKFINIVNTASMAAIHMNLDAEDNEYIENFTFTNNVIDGVTGSNNSGVLMKSITGNVLFEGNTVSNVAWNAVQIATAKADANLVIKNNSFTSSGNSVLNIAAAPKATLENNTVVNESGKTGIWYPAEAKTGNTYYKTLVESLMAITSENNAVEILDDITIDYKWDNRYTGAKITVPVTINGNNKTIKLTGQINDGGNQHAFFRFENDATVKDLTIDLSEATSANATRMRAISAKSNLTVDNCTFIGNAAYTNTRAIIFGEGAGEAAGNINVSVTNSEFTDWRKGITDNENGQDVKTVTVTGNTFTNASIGISAAETIEFNNNTVSGGNVTITSYTIPNELSVVANGNTLDETLVNSIKADTIDADSAFVLPAADVNGKKYWTVTEAMDAAKKDEVIKIANNKDAKINEITKVDDETFKAGETEVITTDIDEGIEVTVPELVSHVLESYDGKQGTYEVVVDHKNTAYNEAAATLDLDISLKHTYDGVTKDVEVPDGTFFTVKVKLPENADSSVTPVVKHNGAEISGVKVVEGYVVFETDGFSPYTIEYKLLGISAPATMCEKAQVKFVVSEENENNTVYDIILESTDGNEIFGLVSAQMDILEDVDMSGVNFLVEGANDFIVTNDSDSYMFTLKSADNQALADTKSGTSVKIGKLTISGFTTDPIEWTVGTYTVNSVINGDDGAATSYLDTTVTTNETKNIDIKLTGGSVTYEKDVPKQELTVEVTFPKAIEDNNYNYQDMKITVTEQDYGTVEVFNLGTGGKATITDDKYVVSKDLPKYKTYTVKIEGAGYRTFTKTVDLDADKTMIVWNNYKDNGALIIKDGETEPEAKATITFLAGDIVKDNTVNAYDLSVLLSYAFTDGIVTTAVSKYTQYDLNRDGLINYKDAAMILDTWVWGK